MPNKIAASKEKYKTYLLPSIKWKNLSLTAMVTNFNHRISFFQLAIYYDLDFSFALFEL